MEMSSKLTIQASSSLSKHKAEIVINLIRTYTGRNQTVPTIIETQTEIACSEGFFLIPELILVTQPNSTQSKTSFYFIDP